MGNISTTGSFSVRGGTRKKVYRKDGKRYYRAGKSGMKLLKRGKKAPKKK